MPKLNIGVLASGRGSNFDAIVKSLSRDPFGAQVGILICNNPDAPALRRAETHEIPAVTLDHHDYKSRKSFELALIAEFERHEVHLVCLAGFMRILSPTFVSHYEDRIMNIHPSLLPAFGKLQGMQVHEAVIAAGVKVTGCTVHFVTPEVDAGPIIVQRAIPVREDETPASLAVRVLLEEHQAYPEAVKLFCKNRLKVQGRTVHILGL